MVSETGALLGTLNPPEITFSPAPQFAVPSKVVPGGLGSSATGTLWVSIVPRRLLPTGKRRFSFFRVTFLATFAAIVLTLCLLMLIVAS